MVKVRWHTPAPIWKNALQDASTQRFKRPELLRFATDTFMEDFQTTLDSTPEEVPDFVARIETWRDTDQSTAVGWQPETAYTPNETIPLYQPAHQRFYLVSASLVCQKRGLPDKVINTGENEAASFVIRRRVATGTTSYDEYGWFGDAGWKRIPSPESIDITSGSSVEREERLPLFPASYGENGKRRRLMLGFIPVANREVYEAATQEASTAPTEEDALNDARQEILASALANLRRLDEIVLLNGPDGLYISETDAQDVFAFAALDLADFLAEYVENVWAAIRDDVNNPVFDLDEETDIYNALNGNLSTIDTPTTWDTWRDALRDVALPANREALLDGPRETGRTLESDGWSNSEIDAAIGALNIDTLIDRVDDYRDATPPPPREEIPGAPADIDPATGATYHIRCVYERPRCAQNKKKPVVSPPTHPFRLAQFFDPDAPVRPTRITLPVDTSLSGLRKFPKNVSFLLSNELRKQASRIDGVDFDALSEGEIGSGSGFNLGMICSLSIPIITICAFILLLIIVSLLNIVFWWIPLFKICFPLNLKAN